MRLLALLLLGFGPPTQFTTQAARYVEVASTSPGPLTVWLEDSGVVKANGQTVTDSATYIAVASSGDFALVVWTRPDRSVMAMRLRPDGTAAGIARKIGSSGVGPIAIADASDRYFVAWGGPFGQAYAAIVSSIGISLVPAMPINTQSSAEIGGIAVAAANDGFAVVWHTFPEAKVFATTLTASGVPVSMTPVLIEDHGAFSDVASDGDGFFVAWSADETIYARTLSLEQELGRVRTVTTGIAPRVAWDGFAYGLAFAREVRPRPGTAFHQLMTMRITEYGTYVEHLEPASTLVPRAFDVDARDGRLDLAYSVGGVAAQSTTVGEPRTRVRAVRH